MQKTKWIFVLLRSCSHLILNTFARRHTFTDADFASHCDAEVVKNAFRLYESMILKHEDGNRFLLKNPQGEFWEGKGSQEDIVLVLK